MQLPEALEALHAHRVIDDDVEPPLVVRVQRFDAVAPGEFLEKLMQPRHGAPDSPG